jgi:F0F1-type ATP synthase membrane subunit b/b'
MEKVWKELRKIESEAEQVHSETLKKSEELIAFAKQDSEKLLSASEKHVETEVNELLNRFLRDSADERDAALEKNEKYIKDLREKVKESFDAAVNMTFDAVLGKIKV